MVTSWSHVCTHDHCQPHPLVNLSQIIGAFKMEDNSIDTTLVQSPAVAVSTSGFNFGTLRVYTKTGRYRDYNLETGNFHSNEPFVGV